ncbi:DUF1211 domain-containing protein, partial [bacterium]
MWGRNKEMGADFARLYNLTDGVFSIVLTLLTLNIKIPDLPDRATDLEIWRSLNLDVHDLVGYALSYLVVGIYWTVHHRMFRHIVRYDRRLIWRNLVFLFLLSLLPFTTTLSTSNGLTRLPWVLYAANIALVGTSLAMLWRYATIADHVDKRVSQKVRESYLEGASVGPVVFLLSMVVALFHLEAARYVPLLLIPYGYFRRNATDSEPIFP